MFNKYIIFNFKNIILTILFQLIVLSLFLVITLYKFNYKIASSGLLGGITGTLSFLIFFSIYYFIYKNNISHKIIIRKFYIATLSKILFLVFVLCILLKMGINSPFCFFVFLFISQTTFWLIYAFFLMRI